MTEVLDDDEDDDDEDESETSLMVVTLNSFPAQNHSIIFSPDSFQGNPLTSKASLRLDTNTNNSG